MPGTANDTASPPESRPAWARMKIPSPEIAPAFRESLVSRSSFEVRDLADDEVELVADLERAIAGAWWD